MQKFFTIEKMWWLALVLSGVAVYLIAMAFAANQSIWFDEGYSILLAKSDWSQLFALTAVDAHPPFYYMLLKVWGTIFGFGEFALRSLSAILLSAAVVTSLALVRKLFSTKVALYVLPFILFAPFLIRYGYEVRMYSLALLIGVVATYALVVAIEKNTWWRWLGYAALVALGMYTLYMTVVVWLAHVVWLLIITLKAKKRPPLKSLKWLYAYAASVLLFSPYIYTFFYQLLNSALPGVGSELTLTKLVDVGTTLSVYTPEWQIGGWLSLLLIISAAITIILGVKIHRNLPASVQKYYGLLVVLVVVPLLFYVITSLPPRTPIFINRYLGHIAVFIYMLAGVTIALSVTYRSSLKGVYRKLPFVGYGLAVLVVGLGMAQLYITGNFVFERMQHPQTSDLRQNITCNDTTTVVASDPYTFIDSVYYFDGCDIRFFSQDDVANKGGYAPLHNSSLRVEGSAQLDAKTVVTLGWVGGDAAFIVDDRYQLTASYQKDKQLFEVYTLTEE